eukprot:CAMPEP_0170585568 /NCGR_PEP_ID=MMETSP0224-20130122/9284_1 /TAXON_ID=285029 /ORGANISM="Togula jolla, Strain CCCM 725" /LENGTH=44 /DNA_ID= /DNA_START= /DNA_END= /DNA_ORIENTATION=
MTQDEKLIRSLRTPRATSTCFFSSYVSPSAGLPALFSRASDFDL